MLSSFGPLFVLFVTSYVATTVFIHCLNMRYLKLDSRTYFTRRKSSTVFLFYYAATAPVGQGLLIVEDSWSHSDTPHSVGLLWTSDQTDVETSTWQHTTLTTDRHPCPHLGFEPTITVSERSQTHALDCTATGIGSTVVGTQQKLHQYPIKIILYFIWMILIF
jgi:hypothetical protein